MSDPVKSAGRALELLELLAQHPDGLTFADLGDLTAWPKSSLYGLLGTLTGRGFAHLDDDSHRYLVGVRAWEVGQAFGANAHLARVAAGPMRTLREELNETVQLAVLDGFENVYLAKYDSTHPLTLASHVGARLPAHVTAIGKAILAELAETEVRTLYSGVDLPTYTEQTLTSLADILDELEQTRKRGYALDRGEYTVGLTCVAAPIRRTNATAAGLSVSVPTVRMDEARTRDIATAVNATAAAVTAALSHGGAGQQGVPAAGGPEHNRKELS